MTIARIERFALDSTDLRRARIFYEDHLGAAASTAAPGAVAVEFCGVRLQLMQRAPDARIGFALGSADGVDELTARLAAAGYRVLEWPRRIPDGAYESLVLDPDGNPIALTV